MQIKSTNTLQKKKKIAVFFQFIFTKAFLKRKMDFIVILTYSIILHKRLIIIVFRHGIFFRGYFGFGTFCEGYFDVDPYSLYYLRLFLKKLQKVKDIVTDGEILYCTVTKINTADYDN